MEEWQTVAAACALQDAFGLALEASYTAESTKTIENQPIAEMLGGRDRNVLVDVLAEAFDHAFEFALERERRALVERLRHQVGIEVSRNFDALTSGLEPGP